MRRAVLSLPSKPWKKVKVEALGGPRFRIAKITAGKQTDTLSEDSCRCKPMT